MLNNNLRIARDGHTRAISEFSGKSDRDSQAQEFRKVGGQL